MAKQFDRDLDDDYGLPQSNWENTRESLHRGTSTRVIRSTRLGGKDRSVRKVARRLAKQLGN